MMVGMGLVCWFHPIQPKALALDALIITASALGFYHFNRSPARLFMGDAGSIPLGFLNGYLLLSLAEAGAWVAALILPAYYLSDATFTLIKRALAGKKIWQSHSEHAYQQAVRAGLTHTQVVNRIMILNAVLVMLAILSTLHMMAGIAALVVAYILTTLFIRQLSHASTRS
jgi:UDP-N-acetylmuramyl pentapeptide phosphotransferase/UDP-N-acetylglucosamine-1-phosphate transferase